MPEGHATMVGSGGRKRFGIIRSPVMSCGQWCLRERGREGTVRGVAAFAASFALRRWILRVICRIHAITLR